MWYYLSFLAGGAVQFALAIGLFFVHRAVVKSNLAQHGLDVDTSND